MQLHGSVIVLDSSVEWFIYEAVSNISITISCLDRSPLWLNISNLYNTSTSSKFTYFTNLN